MNKIVLVVIIIVTILIVGGGFYWFQLRPEQIRKECWGKTQKSINGEDATPNKFVPGEIVVQYGGQKAIDDFYNNCLREHGLQ